MIDISRSHTWLSVIQLGWVGLDRPEAVPTASIRTISTISRHLVGTGSLDPQLVSTGLNARYSLPVLVLAIGCVCKPEIRQIVLLRAQFRSDWVDISTRSLWLWRYEFSRTEKLDGGYPTVPDNQLVEYLKQNVRPHNALRKLIVPHSGAVLAGSASPPSMPLPCVSPSIRWSQSLGDQSH